MELTGQLKTCKLIWNSQVREGRPDLRLFHQLYWIIVSSELLVVYIVFPGASLIQGAFPSETVPGRVCLLLQTTSSGGNTFYESETYKLNMFRLFFPLLNISIIIYLRSRVKRFMSGLCPRKQMSCIGVYKRNVISLQTTISWLIIWDISSFLEFGLENLMAVQGHSLPRQVVFWIWNAKGFVFNEGLHFLLPSLLEVPNDSFDERKKTENAFYARKPGSLEPRREEVSRSKEKRGEQGAKEKTAKAPDQQSSLRISISAKELMHKVIKVTEFEHGQSSLAEERIRKGDQGDQDHRGADVSNVPRFNMEVNNESSPNMLNPKLEDKRGKTEKLELSVPTSNSKLSIPTSNDGHFLSIPRTNDGHFRKKQPYIVYCRNHNSFARHT